MTRIFFRQPHQNHKLSRFSFFVSSAFVFFILISLPSSALASFSIETLVGGSSSAGRDASIAIDKDNNLHIAYRESADGTLRYIKRIGKVWSNSTAVDFVGLAAVGSGHNMSIALDGTGNPHIAYLKNIDSPIAVTRQLKYAKFDGVAWATVIIDSGNDGFNPSISIDGAGNPHISYSGIGGLKYAKFNGVAWSVSVIYPSGSFSSLSLDSSGNPSVSFASGGLKYAKFNGVAWSVSDVASCNRCTSIALDGNGYPHIAYQESTATLNYAMFDGSSWLTQTIDSGDARDISIALDGVGNPHISYWVNGINDLKFAYGGVSWSTQTVDSQGIVGQWSSIGVDGLGYLHIAYMDGGNAGLKVAHWTGAPFPAPMGGNARGKVQAPSGFGGLVLGISSITWSWTDNSSNETGFRLYGAATSTGPFVLISDIGPNITSYTETGLSPGTTYFRYVAAVNAGGVVTSGGATAKTSVIADTTPPVSRVTTPLDNSFYTSAVTISGTAYDVHSPLAKVEVSIKDETTLKFWNGASWVATESWVQAQAQGENWSFVPPVESGHSYFAKSRAFDSSGNMELSSTLNGNTWATKSPMPTARQELAVGVINGKLYALGGYTGTSGGVTKLEVYDPTNDTWTPKSPMPTARYALAIGVIDGKLYAVGGWGSNGASRALEVYDPAIDSWTTKTSMPTARSYLSAGVINGKLYVVGGWQGLGALATLEVYDPATDTWTTKTSMPTPRRGSGAGVINGKLYVAGGLSASGSSLSTLEAYDPLTDTWNAKTAMPTARSWVAAGTANGLLYVVGGENNLGALTILSALEAYDPATDTWSAKTSMPTARTLLAAGLVNGMLHAVGGNSGGGHLLATHEVYTPSEASGGVRYTYKDPSATTALPLAPTDFKAQAIYQTSITWSWIDNATNETGFRLYGAPTSTGPFVLISDIGPNITSYTETGLSPGTTYFRYVAAVNAGGVATSNGVSAKTNPTPFFSSEFSVMVTSSPWLFYHTHGNQAIARDSLGNIYIAYPRAESLEHIASENHFIEVAKSADNGKSWILSSVEAGHDPLPPIMAIDSKSAVHLFWNAYEVTGTTHTKLKYSKNSGQGWSPGQDVFPSENANQHVGSLAIDANDSLHLVWTEEGRLKYSRNSGKGWTMPFLISSSGGSPSLFADSKGTLRLIFTEHEGSAGRLRYSKNSGQGWMALQDVPTTPEYAPYWPSMFVDANDTAHVVWEDIDPSNPQITQIRYSKNSGNGWAPVEDVQVISGHMQWAPTVVVDSEKSVHVMWTGADAASGGLPRIKYSKRTSSGWTPWINKTDGSNWQEFPVFRRDRGGFLDWIWSDSLTNPSPGRGIAFGSNQAILLPNVSASAIVFDETPPVSRITTPLDNSFYTSLVTISGTAKDEQSSISKVEVSIKDETTLRFWNGSLWTATESWVQAQGLENWSFVPPVESGHSYFAKSRAFDASGNMESFEALIADTWVTKAPMPTARNEAAAGALNGKLYVAGGSGIGGYLPTLEVYDPATDTWATKSSMPTGRSTLAACVIDGRLYAVGGYRNTAIGGTPLSVLEVYDPATDTWAAKASMFTARFSPAAGTINGKLYVVGGSNGSSLSSLEVYDPATDTWTQKASMPTSRDYLAAEVIDGKLYVVGGRNSSLGNEAILEVYNPATDTWTQKTSMPTARHDLAASAMGGKLYAAGGYNGSPLSMLEVYDPVTDTWTTKAPMPAARYGQTADVLNGRLYVAGGYRNGELPTLEVYTPSEASGGVRYTSNGPTVQTIKDTSPPVSRVTSPLDNSFYTSAVTISGTAKDEQSSISKVEVSIKDETTLRFWNGSAWMETESWVLAQGLENWSFVPPIESGHSYFAKSRAFDASGNMEVYNSSGGVRYTFVASVSNPDTFSTFFSTETVDGAGNVGYYPSIAIDKDGNLHMAYSDSTNFDLRYIKRTGGAWGSPTTVDSVGNVGDYTSIALDGSGNPHISYRDVTNFGLKYAKYNGTTWSIFTVDSAGDANSGHTSIALAGSGNPHISYSEGNAKLKYAKYNGASWSTSTLDSAGTVGVWTSIALDGSGNPHISYRDNTNADLKYARHDGISWTISTVDSEGDVGAYTSIALDGSGNPHISYAGLKYARYNGVSWSISTVDSSGGSHTSLALDGSGNAHIASRAGGSLKYARYNGVSWSIQTIDSAGNVGSDTSIAIDGSGNPHISYCDATNGDLKVAHWTGAPFPAPQIAHQSPSALPLAPSELTAIPSTGKIALSWAVSASTDITAYHVYMATSASNLFAQPAVVLPSTAITWKAGGLTAGLLYQFCVRAKNGFGEEKNTNIVSAAPLANSHNFCSAGIKVPHNGKKVSGERLTVVAETSCGDPSHVDSVRFEYRLASQTNWSAIPAANVNHPNPDSTFPYFVHWNVGALASGEYHVRAVAASKGKEDPSPGYITIFVNHSDPDVLENGTTKIERIGNHKDNKVRAGFGNQVADVDIPAGSLASSETKLSLKFNPSSLPSASGLLSAKAVVSVELENGQHALNKEASLTIPYEDADGDGLVDGLGISEGSLSAYYYDEGKKSWKKLTSSVDASKNIVTLKTNHFSLFGLFAQAISPSAVEIPFALGDAYIFPNPSRGSQNPIFHIEVGEADEVEVFIYDVSGALVETLRTTGSPQTINSTLAYEIPWTPSASGVYVAVIHARRAGQADIRLSRKFGVIR